MIVGADSVNICLLWNHLDDYDITHRRPSERVSLVTMADCVYRLNENKQPFNKYTILSFIIAYHKKSKHMPKNYNPKDSYSANILFKKHHMEEIVEKDDVDELGRAA